MSDAKHARDWNRPASDSRPPARPLADRAGSGDDVTANCKLPEEADAQLHIVLAEIIEGIDVIKTGADRLRGAMRVVLALEVYGRNFDHPDWMSAAR
jgi:hypothetical protein